MKKCRKCNSIYSPAWNSCIKCGSMLFEQGAAERMFSGLNIRPDSSFSLIENAIENTNVLFMLLDKDLKPVMLNKPVEQITGYARNEIFDSGWLDLFFKNNISRQKLFYAFLENCLATRSSRSYICAITKKTGSSCVLFWNVATLLDASGKVSGMLCIASDITESKDSEDDVTAQYTNLRNIFSRIKEYGLITTNLDGKITYYGSSCSSLFGWEKDMTLQGISGIFTDDFNDIFSEKIKKAIINNEEFEEEVVLRKGTEGRFPAIVTTAGVFDNKNDLIGYIFIIRDIAHRKKMEKQMIDSEKLAAIGQLAAGVAHEINNPLLVIMGRLDMLAMEEKELDPQVKTVFDIIKTQAGRIRVIVDRLLSYSRKQAQSMDAMNVNDILKALMPLLAYHPEFKNIIWKEDLAANLPKIAGDFNMLQEVFLNIALNACQAAKEAGHVTVSSAYNNDGYIEVAIKDTGIGIRKEDIGKIFDPFFTTKDNGTGLGLAICQNIIQSHKGKIEVESVLGKGTTFKIRLPVKKE